MRSRRYRGLPVAISCPYRTVDDAVSQALLAAITDPQVTRLPLIGSVEQWISSVDILASAGHRAAFRAAYSALAGPD